MFDLLDYEIVSDLISSPNWASSTVYSSGCCDSSINFFVRILNKDMLFDNLSRPVTLLIAPSPEDDGSCRPANPGMVSCPCIFNSPGVLPPGLDGSEVIANQGHGARNTGRQS